jgi:hypothetical protein
VHPLKIVYFYFLLFNPFFRENATTTGRMTRLFCHNTQYNTQHNNTQHNNTEHNNIICYTQHKRHLLNSLLSVVILSVSFFNIMPCVIIPNVVRLNVVAPRLLLRWLVYRFSAPLATNFDQGPMLQNFLRP